MDANGKIHIVFLTKSLADSGNFCTLDRIKSNLLASHSKLSISILDCSFTDVDEFYSAIEKKPPHLILGLHLFRCHYLAEVKSIPYVILCGGTDINEDANDLNKLKSMMNVVANAKACVVFGQSMKNQLIDLLNRCSYHTSQYIWTIPQGVTVHNLESSDSANSILKRHIPGWSDSCSYFLVMGRLRSVKDPGYILQPFLNWCQSIKNSPDSDLSHHLIYLGSVEEENCEITELLSFIKSHTNVHHVDSLLHSQSQIVLSAAQALINSSRSEGQSLVILEALCLGVPVIARRIPGNMDLIRDKENGYVFNTPLELQDCFSSILSDIELNKKIIANGKQFINDYHSSEAEGNLYYQLFQTILTL